VTDAAPPDDPGIRQTPAGTRIDIRVIPRASRTGIDGVRDGRLVVRVTAPPVDRAANDAVVRVLADRLGVPQRAVSLVSGASGRNKTVEISGLRADQVRKKLG
jgi:uncharacterized protein